MGPNKYGSVQELRSTLGHFKSIKILGWLQFGLVGLVWVSLVGKIWLGWLNRFGLVKFVKVGFLLLRSDPFINFLSLDCLVLVWFGLVWMSLVGRIWLVLSSFGNFISNFHKQEGKKENKYPNIYKLFGFSCNWFGLVWFGSVEFGLVLLSLVWFG